MSVKITHSEYSSEYPTALIKLSLKMGKIPKYKYSICCLFSNLSDGSFLNLCFDL